LIYVSGTYGFAELQLNISAQWGGTTVDAAEAREIILGDEGTPGHLNHHRRYQTHVGYLQTATALLGHIT